jgi:hypothetical protein
VTVSDERTAVLVIRAWREGDAAGAPLLARLTRSDDADAPGREERVAAGEEAILALVAEWLRTFDAR